MQCTAAELLKQFREKMACDDCRGTGSRLAVDDQLGNDLGDGFGKAQHLASAAFIALKKSTDCPSCEGTGLKKPTREGA